MSDADAGDDLPTGVASALQRTIGDDEDDPFGQPVQPFRPSYKVMTENRIPVSKHMGDVWKSRKKQAQKDMETVLEAWAEAERYFLHDQTGHRNKAQGEQSGNVGANKYLGTAWSETENIVFANIQSLMPLVYAKNPTVEITSIEDDQGQLVQSLQRLMNTLISMRTEPGVNLKPRARRAVMSGLIKNAGWLKIGYTRKDQSREQALADMKQITEELEQAEDGDEIRRLEGKLIAIERNVEVNQPHGLSCEFVHPEDLLVDPEASEPDLSDAHWAMQRDMLPTNYLNERYGEYDEGSGQYKMLYKPTHILNASTEEQHQAGDEDLFTISNDNPDRPEHYGFDDQGSFEAAKHTRVWYCWDKPTKRVYMFIDNDWTWPVWVWEDPYGLFEFFPFYNMAFHPPLRGVYGKGEVTYYQDQQDAINDINSMQSRVIQWSRNNGFYNKNLISENEVNKVLEGPDGTFSGIELPPDTTVVPRHIVRDVAG